MSRVHRINLMISIVLILLGSFVFWVVVPAEVRDVPGFGFSARLYPRAWLLIFLALSAGLLMESIMKAPLVEEMDGEALSLVALKSILPSLCLSMIYALFLEHLGFILTTLFILIAFMLLYGERHYLTVGGVAVGITGAVYLFWDLVLKLPLP